MDVSSSLGVHILESDLTVPPNKYMESDLWSTLGVVQ